MKQEILLIALVGVLMGCTYESGKENVSDKPMPKAEASDPPRHPEETMPDQTPQLQATEPESKPKPDATKEKPKPKVKPKPTKKNAKALAELAKWLLAVSRRKGWETDRKSNNTNAQIRGVFLNEKTLYLAAPRNFTYTTVEGPVDKVFLQLFSAEPLEMQRTLIGKSEGHEIWKVDRPEFIKRFQFTFIFGETTEWG